MNVEPQVAVNYPNLPLLQKHRALKEDAKLLTYFIALDNETQDFRCGPRAMQVFVARRLDREMTHPYLHAAGGLRWVLHLQGVGAILVYARSPA